MPSRSPTSAVDTPSRSAALLALAARTGVFVHPVPFILGVTAAVQIVVLAIQGQFTADRLLAAAAAAVPVAIVTPLGVRLRDRLAGPAFERAVLAVLLVSAVSLVVDAVR